MSIEAEGLSLAEATTALAGLEDDAPMVEDENVDGGEGEVLDESEGQEVEDQDEDQDEPEYEEGEEDEVHLVKVDGEEVEVPYKELVDGYQRQADYTRKTQEIADQRRQLETAQNGVRDQAVAYAQAYLATAQTIQGFAPTDQDIKDAYATDPMRAAELKQRQDQILQQAQHTKNLAISIHQEIQQGIRQRMAEAGQRLPEYVPEWADLETRKTEVKAVAEYLVQQGLNPQEIERTADPAAWAIARKAMLFDQLQKGTEAKEEPRNVPKIRKTRASRKRLRGGQKRLSQNRKAFDQNPTRSNATALLAQFEE